MVLTPHLNRGLRIPGDQIRKRPVQLTGIHLHLALFKKNSCNTNELIGGRLQILHATLALDLEVDSLPIQTST